MRRILAVPALMLALSLAQPAAAVPGDVAPEGAPNGVVDIGDVLLVLSMTVGNADANMNADISPSTAFGSSRLIVGDGAIDVQDVLLLLRVVVGLERLAGGVDADSGEALAAVTAAHFGFDGLWTALGGALTISELPPLNTPTEEDCAAGGTITILLTLSAQSIEADDCDTGEWLINGSATRSGSLLDEDFDFELDLVLEHASGTVEATGVLVRGAEEEFAPGRLGSPITSMLEVTSTFPGLTSFSFEADLIDPNDSDWPIGTIWVAIDDGPAVELTFDGSSTAVATVTDAGGTRSYTIHLETWAIAAT